MLSNVSVSLRRLVAIGAICFAGNALSAESLTIAVSADITSMDPHYHLYVPNQNVADHVFDRLIHRDNELRMIPGLALSWKAVDDTTWEFKLRPNVKFHDGTPFTADDVAFSIERVPNVQNSPGPLTVYTKSITKVEVINPMTVRFKTARPYPLLPNDMAIVPMVSKKAAEGATTADFNSGKSAIGTGPFKFSAYTKGDRVELKRNDAYWGKKSVWDTVTFKIITNNAARVAALLSNDVKAIDALPVADLPNLKNDKNISVASRTGYRLIYLVPDTSRDVTPFVTDKEGKPLEKNPFKDIRVRRAISKAIDREAIRARVMDGASQPTGQLVIEGIPGYSKDLKVEKNDSGAAKKLLADAGYPDGFGLTIHGPNGRYPQDDQILQAVAQMLARIGISVKVETFPAAAFFPRFNKGEFTLAMSGWAPDSVDASSPLRALLGTKNPEKGWGAFNAGNYSNAKLDQLLDKALNTLDGKARDKLLQDATKVVIEDYALLPLHHQVNLWAMRNTVRYPGRPDERTYAFEFVGGP